MGTSRTTGETASATPRNLTEHETTKWLKILQSGKKSSERVNKNAYTTNNPRSISTLNDKHTMHGTAKLLKIFDHKKA